MGVANQTADVLGWVGDDEEGEEDGEEPKTEMVWQTVARKVAAFC